MTAKRTQSSGQRLDARARSRPRVIGGGRFLETSLGSVQIVAATEDNPPFPVDAVAAEEDTFLVLSADPVVREVREPLIHVMTRVIETQPEEPGSVLVKGRDPVRLLAIVHDLDQEPTWKEEWIKSALDGIFREVKNRRLESIALPLIGTKHGSFGKQRFLVLLRNALQEESPGHLKRIWLVVPDESSHQILEFTGSLGSFVMSPD